MITIITCSMGLPSSTSHHRFAKHATYRGKGYDIYFVIEDIDAPGTVTLFRYGCKNKRPPEKIRLCDKPLTKLTFSTNIDYSRDLYLVAETEMPCSSIAFKV